MVFRTLSISFFILFLASKTIIIENGCQKVCENNNDPLVDSPYQNLIFRDDFEGGKTDDPCYTMHPRCSVRLDWFAEGTCPTDQNYNHLKDLNKCVWTIFTGYDFWRASAVEGGTTYRAENIAIENGELILKASVNPYYKPSSDEVCGVALPDDPFSQNYYGTNCKYALGGVMSRYIDNITKGINAYYGRIDIFAKIETKHGGYGALWMWPEQLGQGYPNVAQTSYLYENENGNMVPYFLGEIDIWENDSSESQKSGIQTYHCWYADDERSSFTPTKVFLDLNKYHHFGVEWNKDSLIFYIDNCYTKRIENGEKASSGGKRELIISDIASFLILNIYLTSEISPDKIDLIRIDQVSIYGN